MATWHRLLIGAHVWDLDGRKYVDMINAPGCYLLGAADPDVNRAVHEAVDNGSFSTLNAPEEVPVPSPAGPLPTRRALATSG